MLTRTYTQGGGFLISLNGSSGDGSPEIWWNEKANAIFLKSSRVGCNDNAWHHIAWVRYGNNHFMLIDGHVVAYNTTTTTYGTTANPLVIGNDTLYGSRDYIGYIQEVRVTKAARYVDIINYPQQSLSDTAYTSTDVVLHLHMDGANNSTTFTDVSGKTVTPSSNAKISTTESRFGGSSGFFNGGTDYLSVAASTDFEFGSGDFTIECWFRVPNVTGNKALFAGNTDFWLGAFVWGNRIGYFASSNGTSWNLIAADSAPSNGGGFHTLSANTWYHFAFVRKGNDFMGFINGKLDLFVTVSGSIVSRPAEVKRIARWGGGDFAPFYGYIDEFRITKGVARYTDNFSLPILPYENQGKMVSLLHMDGANNSTTFTDVSGKTVTANGDAKISTAQSVYGGSSAYFDGSGDYVAIAASTDFEFGSGDFTIECWFRVPNVTGNKALFSSQTGFWLGAFVWNNRVGYFASSNGTTWNLIAADASPNNGLGAHTLSANTWYHFAFVRRGNTWKGFINGELDLAVNVSGSIVARPAEEKRIGYFSGATLGYAFNGYIDDFRIIKGQALYSGLFTPPARKSFERNDIYETDPYWNDVAVLLHMDGDNDSTTFTDVKGKQIINYGNAKISTAYSKFGGSAGYFNGATADYITIPASPDFEFGSGDFTIECWFRIPNFSNNKTIFSGNTNFWMGSFVRASTKKMAYFVSTTGSSWNLIAADTAPSNRKWFNYTYG